MDLEDEFKPVFKYYKSRAPPPNYEGVSDFRRPRGFFNERESDEHGLRNPHTWGDPFVLESGLIVLPDPFTEKGKLEWSLRCLRDFTVRPPYSTNISKESYSDLWSQRFKDPLLYNEKIRWSTLGFHHNWDSKKYDLNQVVNFFPNELASLSKYLIKTVMNRDFEPQAAIVNFYPLNATLSPHTDHSEPNVEAPLLSLSFGQSAIFLIGGETKNVRPTGVFLRHGDVLIMTKESRLSYHAIPRIVKDAKISCGWNEDSNFASEYLQSHRINVNIRQVL